MLWSLTCLAVQGCLASLRLLLKQEAIPQLLRKLNILTRNRIYCRTLVIIPISKNANWIGVERQASCLSLLSKILFIVLPNISQLSDNLLSTSHSIYQNVVVSNLFDRRGVHLYMVSTTNLQFIRNNRSTSLSNFEIVLLSAYDLNVVKGSTSHFKSSLFLSFNTFFPPIILLSIVIDRELFA